MPELEDFVQVLTVGLFDGVGALRVAADVLQLPMGGHISAEVSVEGSRVLESNFPDTIAVGDVAGISEDMVLGWALKFSNAGVVLVGGGPPCQGVSGLNSDRKGALKDARSKLFVHVRRVYELCKKHFRWPGSGALLHGKCFLDGCKGPCYNERGYWRNAVPGRCGRDFHLPATSAVLAILGAALGRKAFKSVRVQELVGSSTG